MFRPLDFLLGHRHVAQARIGAEIRTNPNGVFDVKQSADIGLRIAEVAEGERAVAALGDAGRVFAVDQFGMQTEIAVFRGFGLRIDKAHVVGAGRDTVLTADASVRIHRDDIGLRVAVRGLSRADADAGRVKTLLTGDADVFAFAVAGFDLSAVRAGFSLGSAVLTLERQTMEPRGQLVCFVAGILALSASDAFVLVKDHHILRTLLNRLRGAVGGSFRCRLFFFRRTAGKCQNEQRTGSRAFNESSSVDGTQDFPPGRQKRAVLLGEIRRGGSDRAASGF